VPWRDSYGFLDIAGGLSRDSYVCFLVLGGDFVGSVDWRCLGVVAFATIMRLGVGAL